VLHDCVACNMRVCVATCVLWQGSNRLPYPEEDFWAVTEESVEGNKYVKTLKVGRYS
jgi:hypothetical protein